MEDDNGGGGWFDWLPWRKREGQPEPEAATERGGWLDALPWRREAAEPGPEAAIDTVTVLGMDPFLALTLLIGVLGAGIALYYKPRAFMRGFAEVMGGAVGAVVGTIVGGSVLVILAIVGAIALFGFFAGGGG